MTAMALLKNIGIVLVLVLAINCRCNQADETNANTRRALDSTELSSKGQNVVRGVRRLVDLVDAMEASRQRALRRNQNIAYYAAAAKRDSDRPTVIDAKPQGWRKKRSTSNFSDDIMDIAFINQFDDEEKTFKSTFRDFIDYLEKIHGEYAEFLQMRADSENMQG